MNPVAPNADVYNVPAISANGAAVYFTAFGQLTAEAPLPSGEEVDLYRFDTETEATTYVATVNERDYVDTSADRWWAFPHGEEIGLDPSANWETTPDGRYLLFATTHDVGGYNSTAASPTDCPDATGAAAPNGHCDEVYRYDSAAAPAEALSCVSCDPSGADPSSNALFARSAFATDDPGGSPPKAISDDGSYVFFDSGDGLIPTDTNEKLDVYEWHEGRLSLISSGRESSDSFFLDSSSDGSNVFFGTHASLVSADSDGAGDLYDARIGGGFPTPSGSGPCEGDACQSPPPAPNSPTPATSTSPGPGNPLPSFPRQHHKHKKKDHAPEVSSGSTRQPSSEGGESEPPPQQPAVAAALGLSAFLISAAPAFGSAQAPQWTVTSVSMPTNFTPGDGSGEDSYRVTVTNTGGAASDGSPISIIDQLPAGPIAGRRGCFR